MLFFMKGSLSRAMGGNSQPWFMVCIARFGVVVSIVYLTALSFRLVVLALFIGLVIEGC